MVVRSSAMSRAMVLGVAFVAMACGRRTPVTAPVPAVAARPVHAIVPMPSSVQMSPADTFTIDSTTAVVVASGAGPAAERIASYLATLLGGPGTGRANARGGRSRPAP